jgi:hypothetical protein
MDMEQRCDDSVAQYLRPNRRRWVVCHGQPVIQPANQITISYVAYEQIETVSGLVEVPVPQIMAGEGTMPIS